MNISEPEDGDGRFKTLAIVSASVSLVFILIQLLLIFSIVPGFSEMYRGLGNDSSFWAGLIGSLGSFGLAAIFLLIDITASLVMYRLAKRHRVGLVFVPIAVHFGLVILLPVLLYLPMFRIFDMIK